jgi:superfamily I DNA/RNA helicase
VVRHGYEPIIVRPDDRRSLEVALTNQVLGTIQNLGVPPGDMAVLVRTRAELDRYSSVLGRAGIPYVDLQDYDGTTSDHVKVGTFKRAKGLEFKYVLIPGLRAGETPMWPGESEDSHRERAERERRELYVGMTRARDGLWLGYLPD